MAKDGTARGGARLGAGRKPKATDGVEALTVQDIVHLEPADFEGADMPPIRAYLDSPQKNGKPFLAKQIYSEVYAWLKSLRCDSFVNSQLVEQFAVSEARRIQCEEAISEYGFLAKHPTTGNAISSPYVSMLAQFHKQSTQAMYQINQIVKEHSAEGFGPPSPQADQMEKLLAMRSKK